MATTVPPARPTRRRPLLTREVESAPAGGFDVDAWARRYAQVVLAVAGLVPGDGILRAEPDAPAAPGPAACAA